MKGKRFVQAWAVLALLVSLGIGVGGASSAVDELGPEGAAGTAFTYQGQLRDGSGPVNATCDLQFKLWDAGSGGGQVGGTILLEDVVLVDGLFTARLDFGAAAFRGQARYLEVAASCPVGSAFVPLPRQELTGSPYALWALGAAWAGLEGVPVDLADGDQDTLYSAGTGLDLVGGTKFQADTAEIQARVGQSCAVGNAIRVVNQDGTVTCEPVGTAVHNHWGESWSGSGTGLTLSGGSTGLSGSGTATGVYGESGTTDGYGVYGRTTASSGPAYGVYGRSASTAGIGVAGYATAGSGTTYGAYGRSLSTEGLGVYGWASATGDAAPYGVYGRSDANQGRGVLGYATATSGENFGVRGVSESPDGYGVYGWNTATSGSAYGVYGRSSSSSAGASGVYGYASAASSVRTYGVVGVTESTYGVGVIGSASADSGMAHGVLGWTSSPDGYGGYFANRLYAYAAINSTATPENHVAQIVNTSPDDSPDVLALQVGYTGDPDGGVNFVTFFRGDDTAVGAIEGNGSGGVTYKSGAADYAEFLPRLAVGEAIEPGDLVGVFDGRVTRATRGADQVLVVSSGPIVLGNDPGGEEAGQYEKVALLGQVQVRVRGPVAAGDLIVPSGLEDGTGIAVAPEAITAEQFAQAVGQAWESSAEEGVKGVLVAVGLLHHDPTVAQMAGRLDALEARLAALEVGRGAGASSARLPGGWLLLGGGVVAAGVVVGRRAWGGGR